MSYLSSLRLHFAGRFQANAPTGNNDLDMTNLPVPESQLGYGARGDGAWRLLGCEVTAAFDAKGKAVRSGRDQILTCFVADSDRLSPAKVVDIDQQQPAFPTLYGLEVRISDAMGQNLLRGKCATAAMADLSKNRTDLPEEKGKDGRMGGCFQSVLFDLEWGPLDASPWLRQLRQEVERSQRISIKFNVEGYDCDPKSGNFTTGRIVGTIGPAYLGEPDHFVLGRHLLFELQMNKAVAMVDAITRKIRIDLGNSLRIESLAGPFIDVGPVTARCRAADAGDTRAVDLGEVPYKDPDWYRRTAGICELPTDRDLSDDEWAFIAKNPIEIYSEEMKGRPELALAEVNDGLHVRADDTIFRVEPGRSVTVQFCVTEFGHPPSSPIALSLDFEPKGLDSGPTGPKAGEPATALTLVSTVSDKRGRAHATIKASDPGRPRPYLDGQIYCIRYRIVRNRQNPPPPPFWDLINIRVWSGYRTPRVVTWSNTVSRELEYYKTRFPIMNRFLDLTNEGEVLRRREMLLMAFSLSLDDPNYMPVTRDLSPRRRAAIVRWLKSAATPARESLPEPDRKTFIKARYFSSEILARVVPVALPPDGIAPSDLSKYSALLRVPGAPFYP